MGAFIVYSIEVAVIMSVLYLSYKVLLSTATFHKFNRMILLLIYVASFALPAVIPLLKVSAMETVVEIGMPVVAVVADAGRISGEAPANSSVPVDWNLVFGIVYLVGMSICLILTLASIFRMIRIIKTGESLRPYGNVIVSRLSKGTFSWGNMIIVAQSDIDDDFDKVILHEQTHLNALHWLDLALGQLIVICQWFSPAAYLMMRELKSVHEFEVDSKISSDDPYAYQMMLIKKTAGSSFPTFADSLNSQLKLRITMMLSKRSSERRRLAALALIPMAAVAVVGLSQPAVANVFSTFSDRDSDREINNFVANLQMPEALPGIAMEESAGFQSEKASMTETGSTEIANEKSSSSMPMPQNANEDMATEKTATVSANDSADQTAQDQPAKKKLVCLFDGKPYSGDITKLNSEEIAGMKMVKDNPKYPDGCMEIYTKEYAKANGITFGNNAPQKDENEVYSAVEQPAEFPGVTKALMKYINDNIVFPKSEIDGEDQRKTVIVKMLINEDGSVKAETVLKSVGKPFDDEALRLINGMPKWIPGKNNGKPVASYFTIPIIFTYRASKPAEQK